jgi:hypothetical protein
MPDLRHAPLQLAALPLQIQVESGSQPDSLRDAKCLLQNTFVEILELAEPLTKARPRIWRETLRLE